MPSNKIVIVDYGMGNLHSVHYKLGKLCPEVMVSSSKDDILSASKIILPGVGHFSAGMKNIIERNLKSALDYKALEEKVPILGICLGMQLLTKHSEEGDVEGLGWIDAETKLFDKQKLNGLKIPHMGWNTLEKNDDNAIMAGVAEEDMFYFVHSYFVECEQKENVLCSTEYGIKFHSGISKGNIFGFQFHPEKSHDCGIKLLKNFVNL
jgi:imidazole glycerol-phosphate synthase subunit HisH